jgi:hypothetical protein
MRDYLRNLFPRRGLPAAAPLNAARQRDDRPPSTADGVAELRAQLAAEEAALSWLWPPQDLHDPDAWDTYWRNQISHDVVGIQNIFCDDEEIAGVLRANGLRTVLCVGSGLLREPITLAEAGFDVTAIDLSPYAMNLARRAADHFLGQRAPTPGFVIGDLMDTAICPGPFDMIIERRTLQLFPDGERPAALEAVANRLAQRGIFFSHCHDSRWRPPAEPVHRTASWFHENGWDIWQQRPGSLKDRAAWLYTTTG